MNNPFKDRTSVFNPACIAMWKGMAKERAKKMDREAAESENGDAIIEIDESGHGHMIIMLTQDHTKIALQSEHDELPEIEYPDTLPGLYYADMLLMQTGEDVEIDWEIVKPLYPIFLTNTDASGNEESK